MNKIVLLFLSELNISPKILNSDFIDIYLDEVNNCCELKFKNIPCLENKWIYYHLIKIKEFKYSKFDKDCYKFVFKLNNDLQTLLNFISIFGYSKIDTNIISKITLHFKFFQTHLNMLK